MERKKKKARAASHWLLQWKLSPLHTVSSCKSLHEGHSRMQRFPWECPSKPRAWDSEWALGNSQWQLAVPCSSLLCQSAVASVLYMSLHFHFGRLFWAVYNCLLVASSHEFLDARGCFTSLSEKALMRQRSSGPWLWLIRVPVTMAQFPLQALWSHTCYSSCVIFNPLPQSLPGSSSSTVSKPLNMRFKKVKPILLLSALPGPLPMLVPGCSAQPSQPAQPSHLAICSVAHQPTDLSRVALFHPWAGLILPSQQLPLLHCLAQSCDFKNILSEGNQHGRDLVFFLTNLPVQPSPKRVNPSSLFPAVPSLNRSHCILMPLKSGATLSCHMNHCLY